MSTRPGEGPPPFERACVRDVTHPGVVFCTPKMPLRSVAEMMAQRRIHSVVVSDLDMPVWKHRWGAVSDVALLRGAASDPDATTAEQIAESDFQIASALARA